jgi:nucleoside-diphosphate-sugar epimerase
VKVILLGATGMVGQGVLRECLLDPEVESVLAIGRNATGQRQEKRHEIVLRDLFDFSAIEGQLSGYDACFFCLGVSAVGMEEESYRRVTYDLTISGQNIMQAQPRHDIYICVGCEYRQHRERAHDVGANERPDRERTAADAVRGCVHVPSWLYPATPRDSGKDDVVWSTFTR